MTRPVVLHVIHTSAFGGGPNMLATLCEQLQDDFAMEVVCDGQGDMPARVEKAGAIVHRMPLTTKWSFAARIPSLARLVRARKPAVVHLHGQFAGSFGQLSLLLGGRFKSIYSVQWPSFLDDTTAWSRLRNRVAEQVSCAGAAAVVAVSDADRREFVRRHLCDPVKLMVIHNSWTHDVAPSQSETKDGPVVGFAGRLVDQKGCDVLIRAVPEVSAAHPDVRFLIVGDGPLRADLEDLARELGVAATVSFAGYQAAVPSFLAAMDVVVIPSIYDPFPLITIEAMVLGRPIVASAVGGIPEAVDDGVTGMLVPPRDPRALAAALVRLLDHPDQAARMGAAGRARALKEFSPRAIAGQYADVYRRLLKASS